MEKLTAKQRQLVLFGSEKRIQVRWASANGEGTFNSLFDGVVGYLRRTLDETKSEARKARLAQYFPTNNALIARANAYVVNRALSG